MNFLKTLILSVGLLFVHFFTSAQSVPGASNYHELGLLFSQYQFTGSARIQGIGGTQFSLGGDLSSALSNPAGLGFYNRSEAGISPSFNNFNTNAVYLGTKTGSSLSKFNIDKLGVVFNKSRDDFETGPWRGGSFAITFSRTNDFNGNLQYSGSNPKSDILDYYVSEANIQNVNPDDMVGLTRGAYSTYLLSEFADAFINGADTTYVPFYDRTFFAEFPVDDLPTQQSETITSSGNQSQWSFAFGGNMSDRIYFGAGLGISSINYELTKFYLEEYAGATGDKVIKSAVDEQLTQNGIGINGTFGIIARPINQITIGVSVVTPTWYSLNERFYNRLNAEFDNFDMAGYSDYFDANEDIIANENADFTTFYEDKNNPVLKSESWEEEIFFDYTLTTPWRVNGGATFFLNKLGFITADISWVDYSSTTFGGKGESLEDQNIITKSLYQSVINYSIGVEGRINNFRIRAGYAHFGDPYKEQIDSDRGRTHITGGFGYRKKSFYLDLTAVYAMYTTSYAPYSFDPSVESDEIFKTPYATFDNSNLKIMLGFGIFF